MFKRFQNSEFRFCIFAILAGLCAPLLGDEIPESVMLGKSSITTSFLQSDVSEIPGRVEVIEGAQIHNAPNTKLMDIVKRTSGVRVQNDTIFNPRPQIQIRGINFGTLVMLDGMILSDLEGEARILNQISPFSIDRVEVAKGAFSSLYGAGAIGGVVNFITAMPNEFEVKLAAGYGNEFQKNTADKNVVKLFASVGDSVLNNSLRYKISAGITRSDGYSSFPTYFGSKSAFDTAAGQNISGGYVDKSGQYIIGTGGDRKYFIYDTRAKVEYDLDSSSMLSATIGFSGYEYDFTNFRSFLKDAQGNDVEKLNDIDYFVGSAYGGRGYYNHLLGNVSYLKEFENASLRIQAYSVNLFSVWQDSDQSKDSSRQGGKGVTQDTDSTSNYLDIILQNRFGAHTLSTAAQFRYYRTKQTQSKIDNWQANLYSKDRGTPYRGFSQDAFVSSVYAMLESKFASRFITNIGARYDHWQNINGKFYNDDAQGQNANNLSSTTNVFSPKISVMYKVSDELDLKTSLGTGFRMPTLRNMYQFTHGTRNWEINPNLKQEDSVNFDIGAEFRDVELSESIKLAGSVYYYNIELKNMIYRSGDGSTAKPFKWINAANGRINGVEASAQLGFFEVFDIGASYTYTNARILKNPTDPSTNGNRLSGVPEHMSSVFVNYQARGISQKGGVYANAWAYYAPAFYNSDANKTPIKNSFGQYEDQFTLNAKLGYMFGKSSRANGLDVSLSLYNITNNRYYDYYQVAGASFYAQAVYRL